MNYRTIDTAGQITAVITDKINVANLPKIARSIMASNPKIEQVGYLDGRDFRMMGGELSINGLIAGAYLIGSTGRINQFRFTLNSKTLSLTLPKTLIIGVNKEVVRLQGISYRVIPNIPANNIILPSTKVCLQKLSEGTSASGYIYYNRNTIKPLIYVPATSTYIWENACGSGSLAFSLVTGNVQVVQPSRQIISFKINSKKIVVTTSAKEV